PSTKSRWRSSSSSSRAGLSGWWPVGCRCPRAGWLITSTAVAPSAHPLLRRHEPPKPPVPLEPFELVHAPLLECEPGRAREQPHGIGGEDLVRRGRPHDPRRLVYREAADVAADELDLAHVHARSHAQALPGRGARNRHGALESRPRRREGGEEAVPR